MEVNATVLQAFLVTADVLRSDAQLLLLFHFYPDIYLSQRNSKIFDLPVIESQQSTIK